MRLTITDYDREMTAKVLATQSIEELIEVISGVKDLIFGSNYAYTKDELIGRIKQANRSPANFLPRVWGIRFHTLFLYGYSHPALDLSVEAHNNYKQRMLTDFNWEEFDELLVAS